ncbi:MAG: hypothetical protein ACOCRK_00575, partial [bacterium]
IIFNLAVLKWYNYSNSIDIVESPLMSKLKIILFGVISLFLIKRIFYHLNDKEINIKKTFSIKGIVNGLKILTKLIVFNTVMYLPLTVIYLILKGFQDGGNYHSLFMVLFNILLLIIIGVFATIIAIITAFGNFIIIDNKKDITESFDYLITLIKGYTIKLGIISFIIIYLLISLFFSSITTTSYYYQTAELQGQIVTCYIILTYIIFFLFLGYYNVLKENNYDY